jgi:glycosyltransferase involved in cell wall biosynthesis
MKICMLSASVSRLGGGVFSALRGLATALHNPPDFAVSVIGLRDRLTDEDRPEWQPLSPTACDILGPRSWGFSGDLAPALRSADADLTHVHGLWMYPSLANLMQARRGTPYVISTHGMVDPWAVANASWKKRLALRFYEDAHLHGAGCLHALCEPELRSIRAFGLKNPVCIIPNGVDLIENEPDHSGKPDWSDAVPPGRKTLLFLGRVHPKKNLAALLRAWELVRQRKAPGAADWHLVIAGWDQNNHRQELAALAEELGITDSITFASSQYGVAKRRTYGAADGAVLPSLSEGFPIAVLEAWCAGLPVLMTPECNMSVGFDAGAALRIAPDPASIADGLADFFALDDEARRAIGRRGRQLVEDRFTWNKVAYEIGGVYRWLAGGVDPPACVMH